MRAKRTSIAKSRRRNGHTFITASVRITVLRAAIRYGAPDADDVAQLVLLDCMTRPWLCEPANVGALLQRTRFHVLHALRSLRRHEARGEARFTSYEALQMDNQKRAREIDAID